LISIFFFKTLVINPTTINHTHTRTAQRRTQQVTSKRQPTSPLNNNTPCVSQPSLIPSPPPPPLINNMQVDKMTSFEDFFKLDLIADHDNSDPFSFLTDEFAKDPIMSLPPPPPNPAAFGLFAFDSPTSPSSSSSSLSFAIDPQLVINTPSTLPSPSEFGDVDDEELDDDDDDEQDHLQPLAYLQEPPAESPKTGKLKSRKGTVLSGGIVKKPSTMNGSSGTNNKENAGLTTSKRNAVSSVVATGPRKDGEFPDDWRPSPEEYKKMSSKEKRQLRNKISARNFRVRRKGERFRCSKGLSIFFFKKILF
jgi:hypothetical protein